MATTAFVDGSTLSAAAWANDTDTLVYGRLTSIVGTNTITAAGPASMTAYAAGQRWWFVPANTITGATTINITPSGGSALGARNIFANGIACVGGEMVANVPVHLFDDGTQLNIIGGDGSGPWNGYTPTISADSGTWGALTVTRAAFRLKGKSLDLQLNLACTVGSGSPTEARILLPVSKSGKAVNYFAAYGANNDSAEMCVAQQTPSTYISFQRITAAAWVGACNFHCGVVLELA